MRSSRPALGVLASGSLRLRVEAIDGRAGFITHVADGERHWPAASVPNLPIGGGIDIMAETVAADGDRLRLAGRGNGRGPHGQRVDCVWSTSIVPCPGDGLAFEGWIEVPAPLAEPPAIELWLGPLSTVADRQALTWRRSFVSGPVRNTQGLAGNTVPAAYLYDPVTGVETIVHVDAAALAWAPRRLLDLELRELFDYERLRYGIGLVAARPFPLAPGRHHFRWVLWQRLVGAALDGWEAGARLVDTLAHGLDGAGLPPRDPVMWEQVAAGVIGDLTGAQAQVTVRSGAETFLGLRAYVRDAPAYYDPAPDGFELMTVADVVPPLLLYLRLHPDDAAAALVARIQEALPRFHHPEAHFIANRFPTDGVEAVTDTWYLFLNGLVKLPWVALIAGDHTVGLIARDGLEGAMALASATEYRLPLFADFRPDGGPRAVGPAANPSVAGLLAWAALLAEDVDGLDRRDAARRLLLGLRNGPAGLAHHEPLQLGFAAAAAARLADAGSAAMAPLAELFVRVQLRQLYWDEDPEAVRSGHRVRGMFEACASLLYPALKENIEAILPWTVLLRSGRGPTELLLKVMNLIRVHSLGFFDPLQPLPRGGPAPWIPYENLGTSELPETGSIGREIYGSGEAYWAYLLFEALARADDPTILVVNADLLEPESLRDFPLQRRRLLVYNPTGEDRTFGLTFRALTGDAYRLSGRPRAVDRATLLAGLSLTVPGRSVRSVELDEVAT